MAVGQRVGSRGQYRNGIRRREEILATASEVFGRRGYAAGSLRLIADQVGVTPALILVHFGSKEGLLLAVLDHWLTSSSGANEDVHGLAYLDALKGVMRAHLAERGFIELFATMSVEASDPAHPAHDVVVERYDRLLARLGQELRHARDAGEIRRASDEDLDAAASWLVAMMDGLQIQWLLNPSLDLAGRFDRFVDAFWDRLR